MARSMMKRGLAEGLALPQIETYAPPIQEEEKPEPETIEKEEPIREGETANKEEASEKKESIKEEPEVAEKRTRQARKTGASKKIKKEEEKGEDPEDKKTDTTRVGLPKGWKRNSFVFNEENLELIKCYAFENRMKEKDVINQALNEFFEKHPVQKR